MELLRSLDGAHTRTAAVVARRSHDHSTHANSPIISSRTLTLRTMHELYSAQRRMHLRYSTTDPIGTVLSANMGECRHRALQISDPVFVLRTLPETASAAN